MGPEQQTEDSVAWPSKGEEVGGLQIYWKGRTDRDCRYTGRGKERDGS